MKSVKRPIERKREGKKRGAQVRKIGARFYICAKMERRERGGAVDERESLVSLCCRNWR